jgi:hypothetical protein
LYAGNVDTLYQNPMFHDLFHILSRYEIVEHLRSFDRTTIISTDDQLREVLAGECRDRLVLIDSSRLRVNQEHWLELVASSDFFLCAPGVVHPPAHNAVEAMAVGTIPLINYPDWFFPPLRHGVDCLTFNSLDSLESGITTVLSMPPEDVDRLRRGTLGYYDEHLSLTQFVDRLVRDPTRPLYLHVLEEDEDRIRRAWDMVEGRASPTSGPACGAT